VEEERNWNSYHDPRNDAAAELVLRYESKGKRSLKESFLRTRKRKGKDKNQKKGN